MSKIHKSLRKCAICAKDFSERDVLPGAAIRDTVSELILPDHPDWSQDAFICRPDLSRYSTNYVESLIESERGELSSLEKEVIDR